MQYNVDAWQIICVPNRYLSQGLLISLNDDMRIKMVLVDPKSCYVLVIFMTCV